MGETEHAWVLYCLTPATEGNLLLIPKRHITRFEELNTEEASDLFQLIKKSQDVFKSHYGLSDYLLLQKNGKNAGQSVDHIHIHTIPCPDDIDLKRAFLYRKPLTPQQMRKHVTELRPLF